MNCHDSARSTRYSEFSSPGDGWCGNTDDYYNENYLPNESNIANIPGGASGQQPPPSYNSYYDYHHHHPPPHHDSNVIHPSSGATPPPPPPPPSHLHAQQHHHHPPSHPVSIFPQKRSPSQELIYNNNNNNNNNNYSEPKSPSSSSVTTSPPWNSFHSFYHAKNPSASPTSNNSIGSSPPPTTLAPASSGGNPVDGTLTTPGMGSPKPGRPSFKRRTTANKKERRRTQSINNAFAELRDCIPNVPADTKLSKIKTLRLATSYIAYLSDVLTGDDPLRTPQAFTAEISKKMGRGDEKRRKELLMQELAGVGMKPRHHHDSDSRKTKGRTGWPQHVWALELQN